MPIRKRSSAPVIDYNEPTDQRSWFERAKDQPPKAKKPLPEPNFIEGYGGIPDATRAQVAHVGALFSNDEAKAEGHVFNVTDLLHAVRVPYNKDDAQEKRYRARIRNRGTAITAFCLDCTGGSRKQITECLTTDCPLWNFRLGGDPFRGAR